MGFEGDTGTEGMSVPPARFRPHYHGDIVRILFFVGAILLIVGESTGADLPLTTTGSVVAAILAVIAAGITNPAIGWIHLVNAILAALSALIFGITAVNRFRAGDSFLDFLYIEAIALLSLVALYFATRTLRGMYIRRRQQS